MPSPRLAAVVAAGVLGLAGCASASGNAGPTATAEDIAPAVPSATVSAMPQATAPPAETPEPAQTAFRDRGFLVRDPTVNLDPQAKVIYLTFDDGPWDSSTEAILKILKENHARATFFVVGEMAKQHPDLVAKIIADGHVIGNHTWNHPMLTHLSDAQIKAQLNDTKKVIGPDLSPCLRPPYGDTNDRVKQIAGSLGYHVVLWDEWAQDWTRPPVPTLVNYLKQDTRNHVNILLHDGGGPRENTVEAVRQMMPIWRKQGYTFQPVPACMKPPVSETH